MGYTDHIMTGCVVAFAKAEARSEEETAHLRGYLLGAVLKRMRLQQVPRSQQEQLDEAHANI